MSQQEQKIKVQSRHRYNVAAERIFDTLLDPAKARHFMFATLTGKMIRAEIDPQVGGNFIFVDRRPEGDAAHYGRYLKIERPNALAFEFAVQKEAKERDLVTIEIVTLEKGCEVILTHEVKAEYAGIKKQIQQGWDGILDGLGVELRTKPAAD